MADERTTLQQIKDAITQLTEVRDWAKFHTPKNVACAIAAEAAELLEPFTWLSDGRELLSDPRKMEYLRHELADLLLLVAEFANIAGVDLSDAVTEKLAIIDQKYPVEKIRGKAVKWNEI
jgi:NTP pyrophosphatase (non-canonical NTP hydrolase)